MVFHSYLLIDIGPICNSIAASLCFESREDHRLLKSYNGGLWEKNYKSGSTKLFLISRDWSKKFLFI